MVLEESVVVCVQEKPLKEKFVSELSHLKLEIVISVN